MLEARKNCCLHSLPISVSWTTSVKPVSWPNRKLRKLKNQFYKFFISLVMKPLYPYWWMTVLQAQQAWNNCESCQRRFLLLQFWLLIYFVTFQVFFHWISNEWKGCAFFSFELVRCQLVCSSKVRGKYKRTWFLTSIEGFGRTEKEFDTLQL